jgi:hypothetical protein
MDEPVPNEYKPRSRSFSFKLKREKQKTYEYVGNFNETSVKSCRKTDKRNSEVYDKNIKLYNTIKNQIEKKNALFEMSSPPQKPRKPTNEEFYDIHKMRTEPKNNKLQTIAVLYLQSNGYEVVIDIPRNKLGENLKGYEKWFEPYKAIDLANKVSLTKNENFIDVIKEKSNIKIHSMNNKWVEGKPDEVVEERESRQIEIMSRPHLIPSAPPMPQQQNRWPHKNDHHHPHTAPPPLPLPPQTNYQSMIENSEMFQRFAKTNRNSNIENESVLSEPPAYVGESLQIQPERNDKKFNIVINN